MKPERPKRRGSKRGRRGRTVGVLIWGDLLERHGDVTSGAETQRGVGQESAAAIVPMKPAKAGRGKGQTSSREDAERVRWTRMTVAPRGSALRRVGVSAPKASGRVSASAARSPIAPAAVLGRKLDEPPDADPHVRWCGEGAVVTSLPTPIGGRLHGRGRRSGPDVGTG